MTELRHSGLRTPDPAAHLTPLIFEPAPAPGSATTPAVDPLAAFVDSTRGWGAVQAPIPPGATFGLWLLAAVNTLLGGWSVAVLTDATRCSGLLCRVVTLGGRPALLLGLTACCVLTLAGSAVVTGALTRASSPSWPPLALAVVSGGAAVLGVVLATMFLTVAFMVVGGLMFMLTDR